MSLLTRLSVIEPYDTIAGMEMAAEERFWDGFALAVGDDPRRRTGAIYLLGYAAEMLLKTACFRAAGVTDAVNLANELKTAKKHPSWTKGENLHSVKAWAILLINLKALSSTQRGDICYHADMVQSHWQETLRYRYTEAREDELIDMYTSVEWLRKNYAWFGR